MAARLDFEIDSELETGLTTGHDRDGGGDRPRDPVEEPQAGSERRGDGGKPVGAWAAGRERAEDLDQFRQDKALALLLGHVCMPPTVTERAAPTVIVSAGTALLSLGGTAWAATAEGGPKRLIVIFLRGAVDGPTALARGNLPVASLPRARCPDLASCTGAHAREARMGGDIGGSGTVQR
jgi:hypothetical protein